MKTKLTLSERTYQCSTCGLVLDRDLNAACNLAALAAQVDVAGSGPETVNGRGADRKTPPAGQVAVKRLPGTANGGSDRDRPTARRDYQPCAYQSALRDIPGA